MSSRRPPLFRKRQFEPIIIVTCVRWYCRFCLSLRDLEELMAERGLVVDHTTIWRWVQRYGPEVHRRLRGNVKQKSSRSVRKIDLHRSAGHCREGRVLPVITLLSYDEIPGPVPVSADRS